MRPQILIVDDDKAFQINLQLSLESSNWAVESADDFQMAKQKLEKKDYHLCLVDLHLDKRFDDLFEGLNLIPIIREKSPLSTVVAISCYSESHKNLPAQAQSLGAHDFVNKREMNPFRWIEFVSRTLKNVRMQIP